MLNTIRGIMLIKEVFDVLNKPIFIDFDGVIFDTEKRIQRKKQDLSNVGWDDFFAQLDWFKLIKESRIINDAVYYILEAQNKNRQIAILTKIHTLLEMQAKVQILRNHKITVPILFVPPHVRKSSIYIPSNNEILIDDNIKNLEDWKEHGGTGIYFCERTQDNFKFETVKTLKKIL